MHQSARSTKRSSGARARTFTRVVAAVLAIALLAACGSSSKSGSSTPSITLYSGQHEQTTDAIVSAFEQQSGIHVNVRFDDEDTLVDQIVTEGSHSPADVIYTENSPALEYLQERNLLAPIDPSTLQRTPSQYNSAGGDWVGVSARVSVIIYNPRLIAASQLPTQVLQLSDSKYRGKLAIAPGETDFYPIVTAVERAYGTAEALRWLDGIRSNAGSHVYPDNETISSKVNSGAVAFGVVNQYYYYRMAAEIGSSNIRSKIAYFAPHDPGYVVDVSGAGILASASSREQTLAQAFVAFLTSAQAQEIIANPRDSISFEYPISSGVTTLAPETPFNKLQPYPITVAELGDGSTAIDLLRQAGLL